MTPHDFAALITGSEYGQELTRADEEQAKKLGLIVVFGVSDDLIEFRGAMREEGCVYNGDAIKIDSQGVLPPFDDIDDEEEMADYFKRKDKAVEIKALWSPADQNCSWAYKTEIPHATFNVMERGDVYCIGMVLNFSDLPQVSA